MMVTDINSTSSKEKLALVVAPLISCLLLWVVALIFLPGDWIAHIIIFVTLAIIYPAMLLTFFAIIKPIKKTFILNQVTLIFISVIVGFILSAIIGALYFKASPSEMFGFGIYGLVIALITSVPFGLIAGYKFI
ncbi:hypothetical protein [Kangiella aquimarina]|uniref:Uncharacterized protein n=1 Tax=Kangiella aquimarina TaxID=261965 RepID=A0ABZ0X1S8_9GAMM|nr:hypothetical protein [Kangiella aquimarina]WQG84510.1 hypothetical protein SR900_08530 [Kangiella aquimarina]